MVEEVEEGGRLGLKNLIIPDPSGRFSMDIECVAALLALDREPEE